MKRCSSVVCRESSMGRTIVPFAAEEEQERIEEPSRSLTYLRALRPIRLRRKVDVVALLREDRDLR